MLSRVNHDNIVCLLAYCLKPTLLVSSEHQSEIDSIIERERDETHRDNVTRAHRCAPPRSWNRLLWSLWMGAPSRPFSLTETNPTLLSLTR